MQLVLDLLVPGIIAGVSCYGMAKRVDVYDALLQGAAKGLEILLRILPALVTLLTVVAMLRASGALELAAELLAPALEWLGIPPETVGLMLVRPISGSAALGVGSELITTYGPDSTIGRTAAVMLGSTETTFYSSAVLVVCYNAGKSDARSTGARREKAGGCRPQVYCCPWKGGSVMAERTLHTPLTDLPGVGPARARALAPLGLATVAALLASVPRE